MEKDRGWTFSEIEMEKQGGGRGMGIDRETKRGLK
jgi:hypothetical protein